MVKRRTQSKMQSRGGVEQPQHCEQGEHVEEEPSASVAELQYSKVMYVEVRTERERGLSLVRGVSTQGVCSGVLMVEKTVWIGFIPYFWHSVSGVKLLEGPISLS